MWVRIGSKAAVTALAVAGLAWAPAAPNDCSQIPPGNSLAPVKPAG